MPSASRNQRVPTGGDTPATTAASSLESPNAIVSQNRYRCSRRATGGRPGERIGERRADQPVDACLIPSQLLAAELLRRPLEFAQFTSLAFGSKLQQLGIRASMGSVGDCFDHALIEGFFATLECELIDRRHWRTHEEGRLEVFRWIEASYNRTRRHSSPGYLSPMEYEAMLGTTPTHSDPSK
jgi:hypothetical protein